MTTIAFRDGVMAADSQGSVVSKRDRDRRHDAKRQGRKPWRNWYKRSAWLRIRRRRLASDPLCAICFADGTVNGADTVDHMKPHRGDADLFFEFENTQSLCHSCHSSWKQSQEVRGYDDRIGDDGWPVDPAHPANQ